jgi:FMN-dependent oxidoreductase (nitrilotriacetate monooxygenase family)
MARQILLNAFVVNRPVHQSPGLWRHPADRSTDYKTLEHWTTLARTLERGCFDAVFLADGIGTNETYGASIDAALRHGSMVPTNDPVPLIAAMALVTRDLAFAVTGNVSFEPPYLFARRLSTLDQLTGGRIGWNIVTGTQNSGAKGMGRSGIVVHDTRYDIAEEYLSLVYRLWEESWEDDAVVVDRPNGVFARPEKVHRIRHEGEHSRLDAVHLTEPSPQRTPVLFQAGASNRGREFAARHAECVFLSGPSEGFLRGVIADVRERATQLGRDPADILFFPMITVIVGATEEEARAKHDEYRAFVSDEGSIVQFSGWTGIDFSGHDLDAPLRFQALDTGVRSALESFTTADPDRVWTLREVARHVGIGGRGPVVVGSPTQVADELQHWLAATGADGFNLAYVLMPQSFVDFVDLVVPELQRRGIYKRSYADGTFREKLFGAGRARLPASHPAARSRRPLA